MKHLFSYVVTILIWASIFLWECSVGAWTSKFFLVQFILAWIYLVSASIYIPPYENREIHSKIFGGKIMNLPAGFFLIPFVWWWGHIYAPLRQAVKQDNYFRVDSQDLVKATIIYADRRVDRKRELKGFWGWLEDISRQFISIPKEKNIWAVVISCLLAWVLATYSIKFNKKYFPENFAKESYVKQVDIDNDDSNAKSIFLPTPTHDETEIIPQDPAVTFSEENSKNLEEIENISEEPQIAPSIPKSNGTALSTREMIDSMRRAQGYIKDAPLKNFESPQTGSFEIPNLSNPDMVVKFNTLKEAEEWANEHGRDPSSIKWIDNKGSRSKKYGHFEIPNLLNPGMVIKFNTLKEAEEWANEHGRDQSSIRWVDD